MSAEDELAIPQVPEPKPDDPEDVSWALSTAEAMWARGDHLEGIKWVRKAAEAASEAEADMRAVELAKAAADLAGLIARRSVIDTAPHSGSTLAGTPTSRTISATSRSVPPAPPPPSKPPSPSKAPPPPPSASKPPPPPKVRSMPPPAPIPLPSKSTPPPAPTSSSSSAPRSAPRPLATSGKAQGPAPGKGVLSNRPPAPGDKKGRRRSKDNLEAEARAAGLVDTAAQPVVDAEAAHMAHAKNDEIQAIAKPKPDLERTVVGDMKLLTREHAEEWDSSPPASLAGDEPISERDRKTSVTSVARRPPPQPPRAPGTAPHDPGIHTTQAVRVVVWRDASGVHVAPAGTVVSALKIDAVLVALEPNADLTAWLTQQGR